MVATTGMVAQSHESYSATGSAARYSSMKREVWLRRGEEEEGAGAGEDRERDGWGQEGGEHAQSGPGVCAAFYWVDATALAVSMKAVCLSARGVLPGVGQRDGEAEDLRTAAQAAQAETQPAVIMRVTCCRCYNFLEIRIFACSFQPPPTIQTTHTFKRPACALTSPRAASLTFSHCPAACANEARSSSIAPSRPSPTSAASTSAVSTLRQKVW